MNRRPLSYPNQNSTSKHKTIRTTAEVSPYKITKYRLIKLLGVSFNAVNIGMTWLIGEFSLKPHDKKFQNKSIIRVNADLYCLFVLEDSRECT